MKKIKIIAFIFILCSLLLVGCKKGPDVNPPVQNPQLPAPVIEAKSYITIGSYTTLNVTNYSSLDLFNISIEDPSILSLNSFNCSNVIVLFFFINIILFFAKHFCISFTRNFF